MRVVYQGLLGGISMKREISAGAELIPLAKMRLE